MKYFLSINPFIKISYVLYIFLFIALMPVMAFESRDYLLIDMLVNSCYSDAKLCKKALSKIHNYQKHSATNKNFSCQTRLLGLEANLIMVMNSNLKRKDAKNIIESMKEYC
tara:strand:- start:49 stop:381 length:333 start_codon:yes stop_codon:yes gene_type:complete